MASKYPLKGSVSVAVVGKQGGKILSWEDFFGVLGENKSRDKTGVQAEKEIELVAPQISTEK